MSTWAGIEILDLPVVQIRAVAELGSGHTPSRSHPEYWIPEECTVPWFTLADVNQLRSGVNRIVSNTSQRISQRGIAHSAAVQHPAGTVFLSRTASVGFSGIMGVPMAVSQDFATWRCDKSKLNPEYLYWCLRAMGPEFDRLKQGSTHSTIYMPDIARLRVPLPSTDKQSEIAEYLERETAQIDTLIAKQEALIETLRLRRVAVAEHLLGARVGSGERLKWALVEIDDRARDRVSELPLMSVSIVWGVRRRDDVTIHQAASADPSNYKVVRAGQIVLNRMRAFQGALGVAPEDGLVSPDYAVLAVQDHVCSHWLAETMRTPVFVAEMVRRLKGIGSADLGAVRTPRINVADLKEIRVIVPPPTEQQTQLDELTKQTTKIDALIDKAQRFNELAHERRAALISAAVTGQIGVREQVA